MTVQTPRRPSSLGQDVVPRRTYEPGRPVPPFAPPPAPSRLKDPLWARLVVIFGAVLMMGSGVAIVGSKWLISSASNSITQGNLIEGSGKTEAEGGRNLDGPIDMLLLGVDIRQGWDKNDTRADSIIMLHIPASHDQAFLISVPRDTKAEAPAFRNGFRGGTVKATEVFYHGAQNGGGWEGGAQLMAKTLKNMTGVSFDGAAIIDFGGFKGVIESLGGVRMCVDQEVKSVHYVVVDGKPMYVSNARKAGRSGPPVLHKKGCKNMEAWEALDYARQRKGLRNGDYDRQRHQQQLLKAMAKKAMSGGVATNPLKLNGLLKSAGKAFVLDTGGVPLADFIFTMRGVAANDLVLLRTNSGTFSGDGSGKEVFNEETQAMFEALKNDTLTQFIIDNPGVIAREK